MPNPLERLLKVLCPHLNSHFLIFGFDQSMYFLKFRRKFKLEFFFAIRRFLFASHFIINKHFYVRLNFGYKLRSKTWLGQVISVNNRMLLSGMTFSRRDKEFIRYLKSGKFNLRTNFQEISIFHKIHGTFAFMSLRGCSKFYCFVRENSSVRVKNDFYTHFFASFHNSCGKEPAGSQPPGP